MKNKIIMFILLILFPLIVNAETCDNNKVVVESIELNDKSTSVIETDSASINDKNIILNLNMYEVGNNSKYSITLKNNSDEDYEIDKSNLSYIDGYIEYTLEPTDNSFIIKAKSSKTLVLGVSYIKEIPDNLLSNGSYVENKNISIDLSNKSIINPNTRTGKTIQYIFVISMIFVVAFIMQKKTQHSKYIPIIIGLTIIIPLTVSALCKYQINIESNISITKNGLFSELIKLSKVENACVNKYEGNITETLNNTVSAQNVYFDNCQESRNVIFANYCWQVVRTTETGGIKLIYNGEVVDGKCESTRPNHRGIIRNTTTDFTNMSSATLYGNDFDYDIESGEFTLVDTFESQWNRTNYPDLMRKYTCMSDSATCTTLYSVDGYMNDSSATTTSYKIGNTSYAQIGTSPFSGFRKDYLHSMVGYMFTDTNYYRNSLMMGYKRNTFARDFTYDPETNKYTISDDNAVISDYSSNYRNISNYHYSCIDLVNASGASTESCSSISYVYFATSTTIYYIYLRNGESIKDAINNSLYNEDVNKNNSTIKNMLEVWYEHNLNNYTNRLEDVVYCNNRTIANKYGWDPNGGDVTKELLYKGGTEPTDLTCELVTDQFTVDNNKAKSAYPIGLITTEELNNYSSDTLYTNGNVYWTMSPYGIESYNGNGIGVMVKTNGGQQHVLFTSYAGIRPVVAIKGNTHIISGTGSEDNPWVIE